MKKYRVMSESKIDRTPTQWAEGYLDVLRSIEALMDTTLSSLSDRPTLRRRTLQALRILYDQCMGDYVDWCDIVDRFADDEPQKHGLKSYELLKERWARIRTRAA